MTKYELNICLPINFLTSFDAILLKKVIKCQHELSIFLPKYIQHKSFAFCFSCLLRYRVYQITSEMFLEICKNQIISSSFPPIKQKKRMIPIFIEIYRAKSSITWPIILIYFFCFLKGQMSEYFAKITWQHYSWLYFIISTQQ